MITLPGWLVGVVGTITVELIVLVVVAVTHQK